MSKAEAFQTAPHEETELRLAAVASLFEERGDRLYGEAVSERTHALQSAASAQARGASNALIVAALLHDIGHLLHDRGEDIADHGVDMRHEVIGEKYLRRWFSMDVARPVGLHVEAKRYLCAVEPGYLEGLSPASRQSLSLQGGVMTEQEIARFQQDPYWRDAVLVRLCDEDGKDVAAAPLQIEDFWPLVRKELQAAQTGSVQK